MIIAAERFFQRHKKIRRIIKKQVVTETREIRERNQKLIEIFHSHNNRNQEVQESLRYARRIQNAMLISEDDLKDEFADSFVLSLPKDVVSGDFHWCGHVGDLSVIAVADCTGHGIPGAFMSVLGVSLLNQIILEERMTNPPDILRLLHLRIRKAFSGNEEEPGKAWDGLDIAICVLDRSTNQLTYAGAMRPVYVIKNETLIELKPSRYGIGGVVLEKKRTYPSTVLHLQAGDSFYLFSDGYADQFGGDANKKYRAAKLKEFLLSVTHLDLSTQKSMLELNHNKWKGNNEQVDDVLVVGVRV